MHLRNLILIFVGIPAVELILLFEIHGILGFLSTVLLIFATGIIGAILVKKQGIQNLIKIQQELNIGNLPAPQIMDGIMILLSGALLLTPGILTDIFGFALLTPSFRTFFRTIVINKVKSKYSQNFVQKTAGLLLLFNFANFCQTLLDFADLFFQNEILFGRLK